MSNIPLTKTLVRETVQYWEIKEPRPGTPHEHFPKDGRWKFNGNYEKPTFTPSLVSETEGHDYRFRNHFIVTDGRIAYCSDCSHEFAGQTLDLVPFDECEMSWKDALNRVAGETPKPLEA